MVRAFLFVPKFVTYIQFFRRHTIVHASNDLLSNTVDTVNKDTVLRRHH